MEGIRLLAQHNRAAQLQAHQQQAQAAAFAQQRSNSMVWHQQQQQQQHAGAGNVTAAQMQNGYSNFMPSMMAMQASNMNQMPMVATAKLAPSKKNKLSNSTLAVRSTVPRFNVAGGVYTVAQWARKCVEDNLEFIVKIARRGDPKTDMAMLAYGDGCQTLVFLDDAINKLPKKLSEIPKIHVGVSAAPIDDKKTESELAASGVLQPIDSLWDHLRYEQAVVNKDKKEKIMHIHTSTTVYGDSATGRRRVLQIKTNAPESPFVADSYMRNVVFEQQVLAKWDGQVPGAGPVLVQGPTGMAAATGLGRTKAPTETKAPTGDEPKEYLITFNPKELMLLEKAFDNCLTTRDLKSKADKWTEEDQKKCQLTIIRANNEFKYVRPRKPNRKKTEVEENEAPKEKATKESKKKTTAPKKVEKKVDPVDSDDEPLVNLKTPAKKAQGKANAKKTTPAKKAAPAKKTAAAKKTTPAKSAAPAKKTIAAKKTTPAKKITPAKKPSTPVSKPKAATKKESPAKKATTSAKSKTSPTKKPESKKRTRSTSAVPPAKKTRSTSKARSTRSRK